MFYINKTKNFIKKLNKKIRSNSPKEKFHLFEKILYYVQKIKTLIFESIVIFYKKKVLREKRFKYKSISDLPNKVRIDACNFCQLDCVQCPVKTQDKKIKENNGYGYLKFENFKKFIDNNPQIKEVELSNNGEIFLNPELEDIIKYAYEKNITLCAKNGVNLNTLSEEMAEALVKYQFEEIFISIDAATPETYAIYQKGGDFNKVIHNIKTINKYKEKYNSKYPLLVYKFIVFGHNEHEIPLAKELAKELKMLKICFALNWNKEYSPIKDIEFVKKETNLEISKEIDSCDKIYIDLYKKGIKDINQEIHCKLLFDFPQIDWNGNFLGCCITAFDSFGGNAFDESLLKILNNDKVVYAKKMLTDFSTPPQKDIPCSNCPIYKELIENNCELRE